MANPRSHSHKELVVIAQRWICRQRCGIVITELASVGEIPDAMGWYGYQSTLVECKASKADFKTDAKKSYRQDGAKSLGQHRYYMAPKGLLCVDEIPDKWGLIIVTPGGRTKIVKKSKRFETWREGEILILMSLIRRIGQDAPKGVSIKFYTHENKSTATASVSTEDGGEIGTRLLEQCLDDIQHMTTDDYEELFERAKDREDEFSWRQPESTKVNIPH